MSDTKKYNFISGLPRSGSTLLSTILNQNPIFTAGITDPLFAFVKSKVQAVNSTIGMSSLISDDRLYDLLRADFDSFYKDDTEVCFNTSRSWASETHLLKKLYPDFKMIITFRSIPWILDSFERLHRKNPLKIKPLYNNEDLPSVYDRCGVLMGQYPDKTSHLKPCLDFLKQATSCEEKDNILFVEYEALASHPKEVMQHIYEFLEEEWYEHDFSSTEASYDNYDTDAKIEGLHKVRKKVELLQRETILPKELFDAYQGADFWKQEGSDLSRCKFIHA